MADGHVSSSAETGTNVTWRVPLPPSYMNFVGSRLLTFLLTVQGIGAFALITFGVMFTNAHLAPKVLRPLIRRHLIRAGLRMVPMTIFLALALGLVVIGQTISLLSRVGAT